MRSPTIIIGTGGSGTRVLADILDTAGYFMGSERNRAGDSLSFYNFFESNVNSYLEYTGWLRGSTQTGTYMGWPDMQRDFEAALVKHKDALPAGKQAWGWKAPRSIFLLPFLHSRMQGLTVVHLLRDGRDMAYSRNQNQLHKHGRSVLEPGEESFSVPQQSILLWSRLNVAAAAYGEEHLAGRYLVLRYEDLCAGIDDAVCRLFGFLDVDVDVDVDVAAVLARVQPSPRHQLWKSRAAHEIAMLSRFGALGLSRFGYA